MSLEQLIGYTTAIGSTTRESGNIIGNSLKTIFARITGNTKAIASLDAVGISINDLEGNVRPVSAILEELGNKWQYLDDRQKQNIQTGVGGIYQMTRLGALLNNFSLATAASTTALNSQGSAMREQEKYNESLEARINRLNTAWYSFASTVGESGLYDAIVVGTKTLETMTDSANGIVGVFNIFSVSLGTIGFALTMLSLRFAKLATATGVATAAKVKNLFVTQQSVLAYGKYTAATTSASVATRSLTISKTAATAASTRYAARLAASTTATNAKTAATRTLTTALRTLGTATLVGAGFVILGVVIEKLISRMSEATQASEKIESQLNKNADALTTNKDEVTGLMEEFNALTKAKNENANSWTTEKEEEYLSVQQRLGDMFPALVDHIDATGRSYLHTGDEMERQIALTYDLINAKKEEMKLNAEDVIEDKLKEQEKLRKQIEKLENQQKRAPIQNKDAWTADLESNREKAQKEIAKLEVSIKEAEIQLHNSSAEMISSVLNIADVFSTVDLSSAIKDETEEFIRSLDLSELDSAQLKTFAIEIARIMSEMEKAFQAGDSDKIAKLSDELTETASSASNFEKGITDAGISLDSLTKEASLTGKGAGSVTEDLSMMGETSEEAASSIEKLAESIGELESVEERLSGISSAHVESSQELLYMYEQLTNRMMGYSDVELAILSRKKDLTAEEQLVVQSMKQREDVLAQLMVLYPEYASLQQGAISLSAEQTEAMKREQKANEVLLEAYKLSAEGKYSAEQSATLSQVEATKIRINNIKAEIAALNILRQEAQKAYADIINSHNLSNDDNAARGAMRASMLMGQADSGLEAQFAELDPINSDLDGLVDRIGGYNTSINDAEKNTKAAEKAAKEANKTTSESIYYTDAYKQSMERLSLAIEKQQKLQAKYPKHSEAYRKAVREEIKLQEQQLELIDKQTAALDSQIKSGKIKQTGSISIDTPAKTSSTVSQASTSTASTSQRNLSGWNGPITSVFGAKESFRKNPHTGIDISSPKGTRLDANVGGKVEKTGNTKLSGNHVVVMDSNGYRHFYGHLDSIAVAIGDVVKTGDKLGAVGNTGNVVAGKGGDGSHLHYEIKLNGRNIDPRQFVDSAKGVQTIVSGGETTSSTDTKKDSTLVKTSSGVVDTGQQAIDEAKSAKQALQAEALAKQEHIQNLVFSEVESYLAEYQHLRDIQDKAIEKQEMTQENLLAYTQDHENSINKQYAGEQRKLQLMEQEQEYIQQTLKSGKLTKLQQDQLMTQSLGLHNQMLESQNQIKAYYNEVISGRLNRFDKNMDKHAEALAYEEAQLRSLSRENKNYKKVLNSLSSTRKNQVSEIKNEMNYAHKMLATGNLSTEMYEELTGRIRDLKLELIETSEALQELNYEMVQTNALAADIRIDDIDFNIDYIKGQRDLSEEGSGDYKKTLDSELTELQKKLDELKQKGLNIQIDMKDMDLGHDRLQELEEQLEDNALAYQSVQKEIKGTQKAIDEFGTSIDKSITEKREEFADKMIQALKTAIEHAKDIQLDSIDDLIEEEEKRHERKMKQYDDELDSFEKIIAARKRELSDSDRDRSYDNKLNELYSERQTLQNKKNLLSNVNTYEGKKEREELSKQIADIEKQINEEKYQHEKELREQQLDDMLDDKTEHIEDLKGKEEKHSQDVLSSLNRQKEYWDKHYTDLLNDEKYFAQLKKDISKGTYTEIEARFNEHIKLLTDSLPHLEDTFDGTWKAVGTQIRENVIANLKLLLEEIKTVESEITKMNDLKNKVTLGTDSNSSLFSDVNKTVENHKQSSNGLYSEADLKVILAKFMNEQIAGSLDPVKDKSRIANIKSKSYELAAQGRKEGASISSNTAFASVLDSMSKDQLNQVGSYFESNASSSGFSTQEYLKAIEAFGQSASNGGTMSKGDKQVMMAKYIREYLMKDADSKSKKDSLRSMTDAMAENGRKNTSLVQASSSYDTAFKKLTAKQQSELGQFMLNNSSSVAYPELQDRLKRYAESLNLNYTNKHVGLASGGMSKNWTDKGVDGKGGKEFLLHPKELVNSPLDTDRLLKTASLMDNILTRLGGFTKSPKFEKSASSATSEDNSISVNVHIEKMNGTQKDVDNLNSQIKKTLLREKGKRR